MKLSIDRSQLLQGIFVTSAIAFSNATRPSSMCVPGTDKPCTSGSTGNGNADNRALAESNTTTLAPRNQDANGCFTNAYQAYCPELSACVQTWAEECPVQGETFTGPVILECDEGRCSLNDDCIVYDGANTLGGNYLDELDGKYGLIDTCVANCTGCVKTTKPAAQNASGGWEQDMGCFLGAGQVFCPELDSCIFPLYHTCPLKAEKNFTGRTNLQCDQGRCSLNKECKVYDGANTSFVYYMDELDGQYALFGNCSANCTGCMEVDELVDDSKGWKQDNGCILGAGEVFCPELSRCIFSKDEGCPLQGQTFTGETNLQCDKGRCNLNKECKIYNDNMLYDLYLTDLVGNYTLMDSCSANCTGCKAIIQSSPSSVLRGNKRI